jgi:hypothetical protein
LTEETPKESSVMKLRTLFLLVVVLALVATACGGDASVDETTTTAGAADQTTTTAEATTTTTEATTTTSGGGGSSAALASLRESLARSSEATSGRMEGTITIAGVPDLPGGGTLTMPFSGAFDNEAGNFSFVMDMTSMASQFGEEIPPEMAGLFGDMEIRTIGETSYIRFPFFSLFLGAETEWIAAPAEEGMDAASGFGGASPGNPGDFLATFEDANGTVEELGREEIRGVETTHYLVVFDMEELLENATPEQRAELEAQGPLPIDELPMDLWISDDGLVYKYVIEMDGSDLPEGEAFDSMIMDFEMFDYGEDIVIEPPEEFTEIDSLDFGIPAPPTDT